MTRENRLTCGKGRNSIAVFGERLVIFHIQSDSFFILYDSGAATAVAACGSCVALYAAKLASFSESAHDWFCDFIIAGLTVTAIHALSCSNKQLQL
jgi:hypothetical protein